MTTNHDELFNAPAVREVIQIQTTRLRNQIREILDDKSLTDNQFYVEVLKLTEEVDLKVVASANLEYIRRQLEASQEN